MTSDRRRRRVSIAAAAMAAAIVGLPAPPRVDAAKTDIRVDYDKTFSFAGLRTWAWHPDGAGDVRLAVSSQADPARVAARVDPVVVPAVEREMTARGFTRAAAGADLNVHYYVLATVSQSAQTLGQFLPAVPEWGVPPFSSVTTAEHLSVGTLVIDVTSRLHGRSSGAETRAEDRFRASATSAAKCSKNSRSASEFPPKSEPPAKTRARHDIRMFPTPRTGGAVVSCRTSESRGTRRAVSIGESMSGTTGGAMTTKTACAAVLAAMTAISGRANHQDHTGTASDHRYGRGYRKATAR